MTRVTAASSPGAEGPATLLKLGRRRGKFGRCLLCERERPLTFHHLIPRKLHRRPYYRKHYSREFLNLGIDICRLCHDGIHDLYDEKRLAKDFASLDALRADEAIVRHVAWVAKQRQ